MKAYKGFNKDMTCRDFQYKEGGEYKTDRAKVCESGFHACENPLDCLNYYSPNDGCVYHEVEVSGDIDKAEDDSKVAATRVKIGARLTIAGIVKGAIDFIFSKAKPTSGNYANAATSGDYANAATSGDRAHATTSGDYANAATSGNGANAATSGNGAHAEVNGKDAIAVVLGYKCKARGALGCWLVLTERDHDCHIIGVQAVKVDGENIKADTWYELRGDKVVEAKKED